jgi:hypothetical protein
MRKYRSAFIAAYILIILAGVIWHAGGVSAENTIKLKVNSHTTSTATMANMKPGDQMRSEYTIINEGDEKFDYDVDFKFKSGDADLYEILQMTLEKEGVIIYSGVMSEAAGRVTVGSLAGGGQEVITMDVTFPWEAGNEYQGKQTTVAFEFSASAKPEPSAEPSPSPTATASPEPTIEPSPNPTATATTEPSAGPSAEPTATASPEPTIAPSPSPTATATAEPSSGPSAEPTSGPPTAPTATASPGVPGVIVTPGPSAAPSSGPSATPGPDDITVTEAPVPLGDGGQNNGSAPTASPGAGVTTGSTATPVPSPSPGHEINLADDELPLGGTDAGDPLPDTAEPWYNLILVSLAAAVLCIIILRRLRSKR